jgi:hypothetical protein
LGWNSLVGAYTGIKVAAGEPRSVLRFEAAGSSNSSSQVRVGSILLKKSASKRQGHCLITRTTPMPSGDARPRQAEFYFREE